MYKKISDFKILRLTDNIEIPVDTRNQDYQEYLDWIAQGNTAQPRLSPFEELEEVRTLKKQSIRITYEADCLNSVTSLDIVWDGGFESAIKLDAARRLAEAAGATYVIFYDSVNIAHTMSLADALQVCIAVAIDYQTKLDKKQTAFNAIDNATSISEVNSIEY